MKISDERRMKSESQLNKYKKLVEDRNLVERSELSRNLSEVQDKLFEVERRNQVCSAAGGCGRLFMWFVAGFETKS